MNDFNMEEPISVVVITITVDIVRINSVFFDFICKERAKAITPNLREKATSDHS
jgi:hypothetical protein